MKIIQVIISIIIAQAAGAIGSIFTAQTVTSWYAGLNKPGFNPPGWLFGPVWLLLYTLMGIASFLVWQKWGESSVARGAIIIYIIHLGLNALWSIIFFGFKNPGLAFVEIILLLGMILVLVAMFYLVDKRAAYLMIPYLLWVSFASVLNFFIWHLN